MSEIEQHLCATCGNEHCSYGGYGPIVANGDDRKRLCEHWEPVADLQAENEQLRKERDFYFRQVTENGERAHRAIDALNAENAKLRQLAKEACELARVFFDFGGTFNDLDDLLCEASALGIEVDA